MRLSKFRAVTVGKFKFMARGQINHLSANKSTNIQPNLIQRSLEWLGDTEQTPVHLEITPQTATHYKVIQSLTEECAPAT